MSINVHRSLYEISVVFPHFNATWFLLTDFRKIPNYKI